MVGSKVFIEFISFCIFVICWLDEMSFKVIGWKYNKFLILNEN